MHRPSPARRLVGPLRALEQRPFAVLALLAIIQWSSVLAFAATVRHNGWVYYQGGDQIWYASTGWLLGHGTLPPAEVGFGWPLVLAPLTWFVGGTFVQLLPFLLPVNVVVLGSIVLAGLYAAGTRIAGRWFGLWLAALWVALPFAVVPLFVHRYHDRFVEQFLPQALGLTALADFPSTVALTVAAALLLRSLQPRFANDALLAGLVAGFAVTMKPPNGLFVAGVGLAYLVARDARGAARFAVGFAPALVALAIWKQRGLGALPLLAYDEVRLAADQVVLATGLADRINIDFGAWGRNMAGLREYFYSARVLQWLPFAGAFGLARVHRPAAALCLGWLGAFLLVKGTSPLASVENGSFFRLLMPAYPAYLLLGASTVFLVPGLTRRLGLPRAPAGSSVRFGPRTLAATAIVLAAVPVVLVGAIRPLAGADRAIVQDDVGNILLTPVVDSLAPTVRAEGEARILSWDAGDWRADVFYRVYRTSSPADPDVDCKELGVERCQLRMDLLGVTRSPRWVDGSPPPGVTYRIGVATNWRDDETGGDVFGFSPAVPSG